MHTIVNGVVFLLETKLACGSRDVLNTAHFTLENWRFQEHHYCISTWTCLRLGYQRYPILGYQKYPILG